MGKGEVGKGEMGRHRIIKGQILYLMNCPQDKRSNVADVQSAPLAAFTSWRDIYEMLGMTVEDAIS
jgi:hypothetical protein